MLTNDLSRQIIILGICLSWSILPPNKVIRSDGTIIKVDAHTSPGQEFKSLLTTLKARKTLLLIPTMLASNFFYSYQCVTAPTFSFFVLGHP